MGSIRLLEDFLDGKYPADEFLTWFENGNYDKAPKFLKSAFSKPQLAAMRQEIPLSLLNYLRDQTVCILTASQACSQTPSKAHHPLKYDFASPVRALDEKPRDKDDHQQQQKSRNASGKRNRVQLFSDTKFKEVEISDEELVKKIEESADPKLQSLAERVSAVIQLTSTPTTDVNKSLKLNSASNSKNKGRRSLDSMMAGNSNNYNGGGGGKSSRGSPGPITLDSFVIKPAKPRKNKKGRKSEPTEVTQIAVRKEKSPEKKMPLENINRENQEAEKCSSTMANDNKVTSEKKWPQLKDRMAMKNEENGPKTAKIKAKEDDEKLAKMTHEDKNKYEKSEVWASITQTLDQSLPITKPLGKRPVPIMVSPYKSMTSMEDAMELIEADIDEVTDGEKLEKMANLYNWCVKSRLVPNILVEIYLVLELLTVKDILNGSLNKPHNSLFGSVHNCVYFASKVLMDQIEQFEFMDRVTIVYLVENPRLDMFCPVVKTKLEAILSHRKVRHNSNGLYPDLLQSVRFQSETDNRDTFPDAQTFQDFKKQRDLFYELLRNWKSSTTTASEATTGGNFSTSVTKLLTLQDNPVNLSHFAKLFQEQLLTMCINDLNTNEAAAVDEADLEADLKLLSEIKKKMNPSKWRSLQARLIMPSQFGGPCPGVKFSGSQEFFREFITAGGGCHGFIVHLTDFILATILTMNSVIFDLDELDIQRNDICGTILGLRILAKFLALIETLPYKCSPQGLTQKIISAQLEMRRKVEPSLDLTSILKTALEKRRLVITLPWIIEYCSILDPISVHLTYYQEIFALMVDIYRHNLMPNGQLLEELQSENSDLEEVLSPVKKFYGESKLGKIGTITDFNAFFLCIHLGWFFESPTFPRELFLQHSVSAKMMFKLAVVTNTKSLDQSKCLKLSLLYNCCPYLSELKVILSQFHTGFKVAKVISTTSKNVMTRKVLLDTPTPANKDQGLKDEATKRTEATMMQDALEANFFHNQPVSVKQTIDIVSERISSNLVRIVTKEIVPKDADIVLKELAANLKLLDLENQEMFKEEMLTQVHDLAVKSHVSVRKKAKRVIEEQLRKKVEPALMSLMSDDTKENVMKMTGQIIERRVKNHIIQWMRTNMTKGYFRKAYTKEFEKLWTEQIKVLTMGPGQAKQSAVIHATLQDINQDHVQPISQILIQLKDEIGGLALKNGKNTKMDAKSILTFLDQIEASFAYGYLDSIVEDRSIFDLNVKGFEALSFDWALALVTFNPSLMTPDVQDKLIQLWGGNSSSRSCHFCLSQPPAPLVSLISSRNLYMLSKSTNPNVTWDKFEAFMGRLLQSGLLLPIVLEDQCLVILKKEWPQDQLRRLGSCLKGVIESWKRKNPVPPTAGGGASNTDLLNFTEEFLDWFAWIFSNMACDDDLEVDSLDSFPELSF